MAVTPVTGKVYLCKGVPLSNSYAHSIYFSSLAEQLTYFTGRSDGELSANTTLPSGKVVKVLTKQNYVKKDSGVIKLAVQEEQQEDVNYMIWKTPVVGDTAPGENYTWFFAFITEIAYVSNAVTEIHYELDVLQTYAVQSAWSGAIEFKQCLIERRTPANDTVGIHLEREPFVLNETDFKYNNGSNLHFFSGVYSSWTVLCYIAWDRSEGDQRPSQGFTAGAMQGVRCLVFDTANDFSEWIRAIHGSYDDIISRIVSVVMVPSEFPHATGGVLDNESIYQDTIQLQKYQANVDGYTPAYKKVLTYPFNMLYITDGTNTGEYPYEYFSDTSADFELTLAYQPNPEIMIAPKGYRGLPQARANYDFSLVMNDLPQVPFATDSYKQFMGSKDSTRMLSVIKSSIMGAGAGALKGGGLLGMAGGALGGALGGSVNADIAQAQEEWGGFPITSHGSSATAIAVAGAKTFYDFQKCIRSDVAERLDDFFKRYGYAINKIQTPLASGIPSGRHQLYIKTAGCMCVGGCSAEYLRKVESIFNSGITWWDKNHIGSYN